MEKMLDIVELIAYEKGVESNLVIDLVKECLVKIATDELSSEAVFSAEIDERERTLKLFQKVVICEDGEEDLNSMGISKAKELNAELNIGDELKYEISLENMSRNAINMLFKMLEIRLQKMLEDKLYERLKAKLGKIVSGQVVRVDDEGNTYIEIEEIRGVMSKKNRIKGEEFKVGDTVSCVLKHLRFAKGGMQIELSRTTPKFLIELLHLEVPEIKDGEVVIEGCSRIPGDRAKIALSTQNPKIDPIGSTVGTKGVRINAVSKELNGENIDCVEYCEPLELFVAKSLSPASVSSVKIEENGDKKKAIVTLTSDQKSKAIGKNGVNIRLASMLTQCEIEIKEVGVAELFEQGNLPAEEGKKMGLDALESLFKA
ncbi:transcription termination factor NusA [Helicobacter pametensis]|uniref:transcription termination factor NusA n=1 Tax=Helicobacter pametensis TaxID=95149 RepID=UPI000489A0FA|nr:transcription termination factor NusA [Helicobacter pametensis]